MHVSERTQRYGLVGFPIDKSPSPAMHNAAFAHLGINATYELRPTTPETAAQVLAELQTGVWNGLNVTTPLKTFFAPSVQSNQTAQRAGAVNTLWRDPAGLWHGALTDVEGIRLPIAHRLAMHAATVRTSIQSKSRSHQSPAHALILGAGGATRAAIIALEQIGVQQIHLAARRPNEAQQVADIISPRHRGRLISLDDRDALRTLFPDLHILVQATPVGRNQDRHVLPWENIGPQLIAFDMLYFPRITPFLDDARQAGAAACIEGWEMLLEQGAAAFTLWTQCNAPKDVMQTAILAHLNAMHTTHVT